MKYIIRLEEGILHVGAGEEHMAIGNPVSYVTGNVFITKIAEEY